MQTKPSPEPVTRLATIDVGTNTALLLVADVTAGGELRVVHRERRIVRLGEGVDRSGMVSEAALQRFQETLITYQQRLEPWAVEEVVVTGTSASRDAANQDVLKAVVREATGWTYTILSGDEEARWSFLGALTGVSDLEADAPCVVIDIGGGSTELVAGTRTSGPSTRRSLNIGGVRLTERWTTGQPARRTEQEAMTSHVQQVLEEATLALPAEASLVGASGTVMLLALLQAGVSTLDALSPADHRVAAGVVHAWRSRLFAMSYADVFALSPSLMEGRADIFPAGVLILDEVMRRYNCSAVQASPCSLREGLVLRWLAARQGA